MQISTGRHAEPWMHHDGWFKVYRFKRHKEVWFGHRWIIIEWR